MHDQVTDSNGGDTGATAPVSLRKEKFYMKLEEFKMERMSW
ncbi:MAG: hypothetical protein U9R03_02415 [Candidatus Aerophobetes bacterium]|nr:hypothetical protein [Candidatus Aerophobetes bacterium]